jgi:iron complex transport system ATP-binding protein
MVLELDRLTLAVASRTLLAGLTAKIEPGQLWCVLGRNGAGKSTLLRTLSGLRAPEAGAIRLDGREIGAWPLLALARTRAFLPQQVTDHFPASVVDTIMTARFPYHFRGAAALGYEARLDRLVVEGAMTELDLVGLAERDILSLSGGERRRVSLATVLAQSSPLMLLDEPSAHLDIDVEQRVFKLLLARVRAGASVIASVHDPNLAERHATHAILLGSNGEVAAGPVASVISAETLAKLYAHPVRELALDGQRWFAPGGLG